MDDKGITGLLETRRTMKDSLASSNSMLQDDVDHLPGQHTPDYRLVSNPFDPPSSVHLRQRLASFSIFNEVSESTCSVRC